MRRRRRRYPINNRAWAVGFVGVLLVVVTDLHPIWNRSKDINMRESSSSAALPLPRSKNGRLSIHPPSLPYEIPAWMDTYVKFQNSWTSETSTLDRTEYMLQMSGQGRPPLLIWNCPSKLACGGLGDRLYGIIMGLYIALLSERIFLIQEWNINGIAHPVLDYLQPSHLRWHTALPSRESIDFGQLSTMDDRQHPLLLEPCGLKPDKRDYFLRNNLMTYESQLKESSCFQDYWQAVASTKENDADRPLVELGFHTLFTFTQHVDEQARMLLRKSGIVNGSNNQVSPYIGMHIRTGQGTTWNDPERHSGPANLERFATCALNLRRSIAQKCGVDPNVYVASDNNEAKEFLLSKYSSEGGFKALTDMEILHIDRSNFDQIANIQNAYDNVWGELKLLTDATCLVMSRSKISTLAMELSTQQPRCAVYFDECDEQELQRATEALSC